MTDALHALTDKEKDTLRLIVRGHDAKSAANELGLSVHTINERLRAARRKLDVTSSREAARLLFESEEPEAAAFPENLGHKPLGDANPASTVDPSALTAPANRRVLWIGGIAMIAATALALTLAFTPASPAIDSAEQPSAAPVDQLDAEREAAARQWLALVDSADWEASFAAAGSTFREPNTVAGWKAASELARGPLGAVVERKAIGFHSIASPEKYEFVRFQTDFENQDGVIESITLEREGGVLRVVGYYLN